MSESTQPEPKSIPIPPMPVNLPWPVVELCLEGLRKLSIERAGEAYASLKIASQQHIAQNAAQARRQANVPTPSEAKPTARSKRKK